MDFGFVGPEPKDPNKGRDLVGSLSADFKREECAKRTLAQPREDMIYDEWGVGYATVKNSSGGEYLEAGLKKDFGDRLTYCGMISTQHRLTHGTAEQRRAEARHRIVLPAEELYYHYVKYEMFNPTTDPTLLCRGQFVNTCAIKYLMYVRVLPA